MDGLADQVRELAVQMPLNILGVISLEVAIARQMKVDDDCHDLAGGQTRFTAGSTSMAQELLGPLDGKHLAEIIDMDEKVQ